MHIKSIKVTNFSSLRDTGWIDLAPDLNLFVGLNNSGKSAFLRSFLRDLPNNSHKDETKFRPGELLIPKVELKISIKISEIYERFSRRGQQPTFPAGGSDLVQGQAQLSSLLSDINNSVILEGERTPGNEILPVRGCSIESLRFEGNQVVMNVRSSSNGLVLESRAANPDNLVSVVDDHTAESMFYFSPQRLNIARSPLGEQKRLASDASNLPAVLAYVQGAQAPLFSEIERHVIDIMPGIERITIVPRGSNFEILAWPSRDTIYPELAFSLDDSGTGVGQLLAILTAVVLSEQSIIIIDEINTFLHAAAVKKLLALLRTRYAHHQYILSSHSAEVISSSSRASSIQLSVTDTPHRSGH